MTRRGGAVRGLGGIFAIHAEVQFIGIAIVVEDDLFEAIVEIIVEIVLQVVLLARAFATWSARVAATPSRFALRTWRSRLAWPVGSLLQLS